jgi:hypothetical protein
VNVVFSSVKAAEGGLVVAALVVVVVFVRAWLRTWFALVLNGNVDVEESAHEVEEEAGVVGLVLLLLLLLLFDWRNITLP